MWIWKARKGVAKDNIVSKVKAKAKTVAKKEAVNKIDKEVILTDFERDTVLPKLSSVNEDGVVTRELTIGDFYGMNMYERETEDWTEEIKFLSVQGRFANEAWFKLSVTIVVVEDRRFYMTLGNEEIKKKTGRDCFVNHLPTMTEILDEMTTSYLSPEQVEEEIDAINSFGSDM